MSSYNIVYTRQELFIVIIAIRVCNLVGECAEFSKKNKQHKGKVN